MKIQILGCAGGKSVGFNPTSFLVDGKILIDAGTVVTKLSSQRILEDIDNLILTHSHFDHIADLPFLIQLVYEEKEGEFNLWASGECIDYLVSGVFNFRIWPDLFKMSSTRENRINLMTYSSMKRFCISGYEITPIPVNHTVPTHGVVVDDGKVAFAFSADTYVTDDFWLYCRRKENLKAVIVDVAFPSRMVETASATRHLTPELLSEELEKLAPANPDIYITHIKPQLFEETKKEIEEKFSQTNVFILSEDMVVDV